jgi:hypothetical protein
MIPGKNGDTLVIKEEDKFEIGGYYYNVVGSDLQFTFDPDKNVMLLDFVYQDMCSECEHMYWVITDLKVTELLQ